MGENRAKHQAFTLVELLTAIAIVAMLVVGALVFVPSYQSWAQSVADQRTLTVLNDALTRYKTEGGSLAALTQGAPVTDVIAAMQQPITWAGTTHQVMQLGVSYASHLISAIGNGSSYQFTAYNSYTNISGGVQGGGNHGTLLITSPGTSTWTVPGGVTSITVQAWGGGGTGAGPSSSAAAGGGGGGYAGAVVPVSPNQTVYYTVGAGVAGVAGHATGNGGASWVNVSANSSPGSSSNGCAANGGASATNSALGAGGAGTIGTTLYTGGSGSGNGSKPGAGGGGAGSAANGTTPPLPTNYTEAGGAGGSPDGGAGGAAADVSDATVTGGQPGGGGGGVWYSGLTGNGGNGQVKITW